MCHSRNDRTMKTSSVLFHRTIGPNCRFALTLSSSSMTILIPSLRPSLGFHLWRLRLIACALSAMALCCSPVAASCPTWCFAVRRRGFKRLSASCYLALSCRLRPSPGSIPPTLCIHAIIDRPPRRRIGTKPTLGSWRKPVMSIPSFVTH